MPDIQHAIQIAAPPEAIYPLVSTAAGFGQWWAADVTEPDGCVELGFFNRITIYRLRPLAREPGKQAEWLCETGSEWIGTYLRFRLETVKSGLLLRFTHADWKSETDYFTSCNTTWGELMFRLKAAAEGKSPGPFFRMNDTAY